MFNAYKIPEVIRGNAEIFAVNVSKMNMDGVTDLEQLRNEYIACPIIHLNSKPPYIHTRLIGNQMVHYIWDTREIVGTEEYKSLSMRGDFNFVNLDNNKDIGIPLEPWTGKFQQSSMYVY